MRWCLEVMYFKLRFLVICSVIVPIKRKKSNLLCDEVEFIGIHVCV